MIELVAPRLAMVRGAPALVVTTEPVWFAGISGMPLCHTHLVAMVMQTQTQLPTQKGMQIATLSTFQLRHHPLINQWDFTTAAKDISTFWKLRFKDFLFPAVIGVFLLT